MKFETATIVPTRKVVTALIEGSPQPLFEDTTDANILQALRPLLTFEEFTWGFAGPSDRSTVVVERIYPDEGIEVATVRVKARISEFNANVKENA